MLHAKSHTATAPVQTVFANSYALKAGETIGPESNQFTLIPHIGILQAGKFSNSILLANLNLGYTSYGDNCNLAVQIRAKLSQQEEVIIASTYITADNWYIHTVVALQGHCIVSNTEEKDIDILFYWRIQGSKNIFFGNEQIIGGSAVVSPINNRY